MVTHVTEELQYMPLSLLQRLTKDEDSLHNGAVPSPITRLSCTSLQLWLQSCPVLLHGTDCQGCDYAIFVPSR